MNIKKEARRFFSKIDWFILLLCTGLVILGTVLLLGISQAHYARLLKIGSLNSQIIAAVLGIVSALIIANIDYRAIANKWKIYVPLSYMFLFATFLFGVATPERPDAKRWFIIPGINMSVQPSEFLKLAFILSFAYHAHKTQEKFNHPLNILLLCVHAVIPVALVQYQGDSGTALMFALIFLTMIFMAGLKWVYLLAAAVSIPTAIPIVWNFVLSNMQKRRILSLIGRSEADALGDYYQQSRAALAITSGGRTGNGLFYDAHTYVPEIHNDFIFAFIGDALGIIGCLAVTAVILMINVKILINCAAAQDKQGQIICAGVFAMIFFQSIVNIAMCLSLLPVIGNSLPFVSSGGSSVLANYLGIGLVLSVYKHTNRRRVVENFLPNKGGYLQ